MLLIKDLKIATNLFEKPSVIKCTREKIIEVTAKFFANKNISIKSIKKNQIENHIDNLFLQYQNYDLDMPIVREKSRGA